jgi:hypothetical protein
MDVYITHMLLDSFLLVIRSLVVRIGKMQKNKLKDRMKNYKSSPSTILTPFEFVKIIRNLVFQSCPWSFQMAVALVIGARLYSREMELSSIQFEHFLWNLSYICPDSGLLKGIMLNLHNGKTDPHPALLMLWSSSDSFPLWLKLSKISSGYIFASKERIDSGVPLEQGVKEGEQLTQDMLDNFFRKTAIQVLGIRRKFTGSVQIGFCASWLCAKWLLCKVAFVQIVFIIIAN